MRILFLTLNYPPETKPSQDLIYNLATNLKVLGHEIFLVSAAPNHPKANVFEEFRRPATPRGFKDQIETVETWVLPTNKSGFTWRFFSNLSFVVSSVLVAVRKIGPIDMLIVQSPPLFAGLAGLFIARSKRAKFILNVSDLWPQTPIVLKQLQNRIAIRLSTWLEELLYRKADLISAQTRGIIKSIQGRFPDKRIILVTCGANVNDYKAASQNGPIRQKAKFIVGYAGLHGRAQALDTVLRAAQLLSDRREIKFCLFGDGLEKPRLLRLHQDLGLRQVEFYDSQPKWRMPAVLETFDASIVTLRKGDLFEGALPAKMFEAMAAGVPIVLSVDGEARRLIEDAAAGIYVEPENADAMAQAIVQLYENSTLARTLGLNGRRYAMEHCDWSTIAYGLERELTRLWAGQMPTQD